MDKKGTTLLLGIIEKEQKGLKLKVEGTLLGKIGTLMDEKGTKTFCKERLKRQQGLKRRLFQLLLVFVHLQNRNI